MAVFSGTGNTAHVAELLAAGLRNLNATVAVHRIDTAAVRMAEGGGADFNPAGYDLFGIGHPVLAQVYRGIEVTPVYTVI